MAALDRFHCTSTTYDSQLDEFQSEQSLPVLPLINQSLNCTCHSCSSI